MTRLSQRGANSPTWKGGRVLLARGYIGLKRPDHPRAMHNGYVYEHVLIAERALGRPLPEGAVIHHANEVKADNRPENLVVCQDRGYHVLLHARIRAYIATGDPNAIRCEICHGYGNQADIYRRPRGGTGIHRSCKNARDRARRAG